MNNNINQILNIIKNSSVNDDRVELLKDSISSIDYIANVDALDTIMKVVTSLDQTYEEFVDLLYYFDPVYIYVKEKIKEQEIKKLREKVKEEREIKSNV